MTDQPAGPDHDHDDPPAGSRRRARRKGSDLAGAAPVSARAGRDLRAATTVGVVLAILVVGSLFLWKPAFVGLVVLVMVVGVWELAQALSSRGVTIPLVPVLLGTVLMLVGSYVGGTSPLMVGLGLTVAAVAVWRLGDHRSGYVRDVTAGIFATLYVPFMAGFAMLMLRAEDGTWRIMALLVVVVAADTGGYFAGSLLGRHPLAPTVSPKKSWEGVGGSIVLGVGVGMLISVFALDGTWWSGLVLGLVGVIGATLGDLGESMIKRNLGIKDMSSLLPGHGGFMDRLDSLLPSAPLIWLVLTYLVAP